MSGPWLAIALHLAAVPFFGDAGPVRERILYTAIPRSRPADMDICLFDSPGKAPRRLTDHPALDYDPVFSPDGRRVVFCSERRGNSSVQAVGSGQTRVIGGPALSPAVKSDGLLVYEAQQYGRWIILSAAENGKDIRYEIDCRHECWAPDIDPKTGRMICHGTGEPSKTPQIESPVPGPFLVDNQANPPAHDDLYAVRREDGRVSRLTHNKWEDGIPAWVWLPH